MEYQDTKLDIQEYKTLPSLVKQLAHQCIVHQFYRNQAAQDAANEMLRFGCVNVPHASTAAFYNFSEDNIKLMNDVSKCKSKVTNLMGGYMFLDEPVKTIDSKNVKQAKDDPDATESDEDAKDSNGDAKGDAKKITGCVRLQRSNGFPKWSFVYDPKTKKITLSRA